ncbi:transglutaminase domain-containing protein [Demequina pelophila]|uniref:transglutaminase domain-containing protein n=1 Tax=Demequina pelophila TaxID=1638984 RepID=UPI000785A748|nr:transglutaminase domain-containing protein [Demequina pelophila]
MAARPPASRPALVVGAALFALGMAAAAWWALRPVYGTVRFDLVATAGAAAGILAAVAARALRRRLGLGLALAALLYAAVAFALAVPSAWHGAVGLAQAALDVVRAPVTGWKELVTLPVPVGEYGATLVPPLAAFVAATFAMVWIGSMWIGAFPHRRWPWAAVPGAGLVALAIAVGPASRGAERGAEPLGGVLTREFVVGLVALGIALAWFVWRVSDARRQALRAAFEAEVKVERAPVRALGTVLTATALVSASVIAALAVATPVAAEQEREVARTAIEPRLAVDSSVTPLASYRAAFAEGAYDAPLFTVEIEDGAADDAAGGVDRIRLATLPFFDGDTYSATAPTGVAPLRYRRLPTALPGASSASTVRITIEGLTGLWVPLPGALGDAEFAGGRADVLEDSFYYVADTATGVTTVDGGLVAGDVVVARGAGTTGTLAEAGAAPGVASVPEELLPPSLVEWVDAQGVTSDGAGLARLVEALRSRGYLSHALTADQASAWATDLPGYAFHPSAAGHSYDRLDRLFTALVERETQSAGDGSLVAAAGDDEQFAAAVALVASHLGFPSRVVLGVRLADTDPQGWTPAPCEDGVCRGRHLSAWVEVRAASGEWIAVDVTPQHEEPITPLASDNRDPEYPTATNPRQADEIGATAALEGRSAGEEAVADDATGAVAEVSVARRVARAAGASLALLLVPLLAIVAAKAVRRARRRRRGTTTARVEGGWDEYLDLAVDAGLAARPLATRQEAAVAYGTTHGVRLAALADRATFSTAGCEAGDPDEAWALLAADRAEVLAGMGFWRRLGARLSVRSLTGRARRLPREPRVASADRPARRWTAARTTMESSPARPGRR